MDEHGEPRLPIPISIISGRYLLFDIRAISWIRRNYNICGVCVGTLPQNPSQNVFLGLPVEIMPEEAQLLLELDVAYVLDDARSHDEALSSANTDRQDLYLQEAESAAQGVSEAKAKRKEIDRKKALKKARLKEERTANVTSATSNSLSEEIDAVIDDEAEDRTVELFSPTDAQNLGESTQTIKPSAHDGTPGAPTIRVTPTSSASLLPSNNQSSSIPSNKILGTNLASSALYKHLHQTRSFFMTPGLRFGCQFCVYPGDPLRFHSHFLAVGVDWDEEIDLMNIVGGGRLGTGVKKGYLFGGREPGMKLEKDGRMRCFSVEWAAM